MAFIPHTPDDIAGMLKVIGAGSIDELTAIDARNVVVRSSSLLESSQMKSHVVVVATTVMMILPLLKN